MFRSDEPDHQWHSCSSYIIITYCSWSCYVAQWHLYLSDILFVNKEYNNYCQTRNVCWHDIFVIFADCTILWKYQADNSSSFTCLQFTNQCWEDGNDWCLGQSMSKLCWSLWTSLKWAPWSDWSCTLKSCWKWVKLSCRDGEVCLECSLMTCINKQKQTARIMSCPAFLDHWSQRTPWLLSTSRFDGD